MTSPTSTLDQHARASYHAARIQLSARTVAELNRRRIGVCTAQASVRPHTRRFGWPLATALGGACAFVLTLGLLWPPSAPVSAPLTFALENATDTTDPLNALDALEAINLTALDEDSDFFLWLTTYEASLLAME